jgi:hypothetical protein
MLLKLKRMVIGGDLWWQFAMRHAGITNLLTVGA